MAIQILAVLSALTKAQKDTKECFSDAPVSPSPIQSCPAEKEAFLLSHATSKKIESTYLALSSVEVVRIPFQRVSVNVPYMLNVDDYTSDAITWRKNNPEIESIVNKYPLGFRLGKAEANDIKSFIQTVINKDIVKPADVRNLLENSGIGVDCSGFATQVYNDLIDQFGLSTQKFDILMTGSSSFRSSINKDFIKVNNPIDLIPGDAFYLDNPDGVDHIRVVQSVTRTSGPIGMVSFVTVESTARGPVNGVKKRYWRYKNFFSFGGLEVSNDNGETYVHSTEKPEFSHFKPLYYSSGYTPVP